MIRKSILCSQNEKEQVRQPFRPVCLLFLLIQSCSDLFLQPLVEPFKEGALPQHAVLRLQYPVIFVRINQ